MNLHNQKHCGHFRRRQPSNIQIETRQSTRSVLFMCDGAARFSFVLPTSKKKKTPNCSKSRTIPVVFIKAKTWEKERLYTDSISHRNSREVPPSHERMPCGPGCRDNSSCIKQYGQEISAGSLPHVQGTCRVKCMSIFYPCQLADRQVVYFLRRPKDSGSNQINIKLKPRINHGTTKLKKKKGEGHVRG